MTEAQLILAGRLLVAFYFVASGVRHFWVFAGVREMMVKRGVPMATAGLVIGTAIDILGGLAIAAGRYVIPAAIALSLFTLAASVIAFDFWNQQEPQRSASISGWFANIAVIGGLLLIVAQAMAFAI